MALALAALSCSDDAADQTVPTSTDESTQAATVAPTVEPTAEPTPAGPATTFGDGTKTVGQDIAPGTYRGNLDSGLCYWERLSGFSGALDDVITNANPSYPEIVAIAETDVGFNSQRCGEWSQGLTPITASQTDPFEDGTFAVGVDIAPGTWRTAGGDACYWERLSGFGHEIADILANEAGAVGPIVTIAAGDVGFSAHGCGAWSIQ